MAELTFEMAEDLQERLYELDVEVSLRADYSGRGMYGKECVAFTFDDQPARVMAALGWVMREQMEEAERGELGDESPWYDVGFRDAFDMLPTRTDSMGLGTVLY